jgi:hypothetical protein
MQASNGSLKHVEFSEACRAGKGETDDLVERATVAHITGYYVEVEELDRSPYRPHRPRSRHNPIAPTASRLRSCGTVVSNVDGRVESSAPTVRTKPLKK